MALYSLSMGTAKMDITPQQPVQLAGFASRCGALYEGVDSPLYARIFYLRQQSERDTVQQSLVVIADLLNWEGRLGEQLRARIAKAYGIPADAVILHATHSHSGPATMDGIDIGVPSADYLQHLQTAVFEGARTAIATCEPVRIERGAATLDLAWNRRNEELKDDELNLIRFMTNTGKVKALWMNYACHPVLSRELIVSSEYCGYAADQLEERLGEGAIAGFLQGTSADINPRLASGARDLGAVREAGERLLQATIDIMEHGMERVHLGAMEVRSYTAELPYERVPTEEELKQRQLDGSPVEQKWATFMLENPDRLKPAATLEITVLELSDRLSVLFMNGEIVSRFGLLVKSLSAGTTIPVAYSHDFIGYVTTEAQLQAGGYEPHGSIYYLGLPSPYARNVEAIVVDLIEKAQKIKGGSLMSSSDKLAVDGGVPIRTEGFARWPIYDKLEEQMLLEVLHSGKWGGVGNVNSPAFEPKIPLLEQKFAEFQDAQYAIACCNGTVAITIALQAAGVMPGDEVIMPPYTFIATASSALSYGAIPVFADIDPDTLLLDPDAVERLVTSKTKAIIAVHIAGAPADLTRLAAIADKHGLMLIEDSAQAVGAEWNNRKVGAIGHIGTFSFQSSKNLNSGEGGMIVTNSKELWEKAWSIVNVGRIPNGAWYQHERIGQNYRLTEFQAAILLAQLTRLEEQMELRERNALLLDSLLENVEGISPVRALQGTTRHAYHLYMLLLSEELSERIDKNDFIRKVNAEGIPLGYGYVSLNQNKAIQNSIHEWTGTPRQDSCPISEKLCDKRALWLSQTLLLSEEQALRDTAAALRKVLNSYR